jgi:single-strand DNA-binding protein
MANLNKVMLIGRLTRDPEVRTFSNGGKVAAFGFAVNNRKKNQQTGAWEDEPCFLDIEAFNRETGRKLADLVEQYLHKGHQAYIEGHLKLDQWTDKDGQKRQKIKIVLDDMQFLEPKSDGGNSGRGDGESRPARGMNASAPARQPAPAPSRHDEYEDEPPLARGGNTTPEDDIPF